MFLADTNLAAFHSLMLCGCLFLAMVLLAGEPGLGFRSHTSWRESSTAEVFLWNLSCLLVGAEPALFIVSALPSSLDMISSVNPWL